MQQSNCNFLFEKANSPKMTNHSCKIFWKYFKVSSKKVYPPVNFGIFFHPARLYSRPTQLFMFMRFTLPSWSKKLFIYGLLSLFSILSKPWWFQISVNVNKSVSIDLFNTKISSKAPPYPLYFIPDYLKLDKNSILTIYFSLPVYKSNNITYLYNLQKIECTHIKDTA